MVTWQNVDIPVKLLLQSQPCWIIKDPLAKLDFEVCILGNSLIRKLSAIFVTNYMTFWRLENIAFAQ